MEAIANASNEVESIAPTRKDLSNQLITSASKWAAAATLIPVNGLD